MTAALLRWTGERQPYAARGWFDETYLHYAENQSGQNRLILFCDIERPMRYRWAQARKPLAGAQWDR